jgi:two-component system sensor histidine kinase/response regulator
VAVTVETWPEDSALLHFSVRDTGVGVPQDKQKIIFEAFTQVDGSTTRKFGGTGLGLSIASRLVEMMGGRIWMESAAHTGSTFHFTARLEAVSTAAGAGTVPLAAQPDDGTGTALPAFATNSGRPRPDDHPPQFLDRLRSW